MIESIGPLLQATETILPEQLNTLTLERNSALIVRFAKDSGYDLSELQMLRQQLMNIFPDHPVFVWYDDIDFTVIHDKACKPERLEHLNDTSNYY